MRESLITELICCSWSPIIDFIDDQHESYMRQEQQPFRKDKQDMRIHACLYFVKPGGHT